jgi:hypothetical protein
MDFIKSPETLRLVVYICLIMLSSCGGFLLYIFKEYVSYRRQSETRNESRFIGIENKSNDHETRLSVMEGVCKERHEQ